ncbi:MAG: YceI family protein [Bdellovibrio sp.]|nr:YceI family protein [Bdellovibrio sp.]
MKHSIQNFLKPFIITVLLSVSAFAQQKGVKVFVTLFPAGDFIAQTADVTGFAEIVSPTEVKASNIKINLKTLKTGMDLRDDHAKNKYLEVEKYPEAILVSATGKNGKGSGVLKMRNKESKVEGTYTLLGGNKFLKAEFKTKLSQYDIKEINYKGVGVDDEIKVEVIVPVQAAAAASAKPAGKK